MRARIIFLGLLAGSLVLLGLSAQTQPEDAPPKPPKPIVLTIDFGDGFQMRYTKLPWHTGMTVVDALDLAAEHENHPLDFIVRGSGKSAFIKSIEGVKNTGRPRKDSRNWLFWVDGEFANRGAGDVELDPGDAVTWRHAEWEYD